MPYMTFDRFLQKRFNFFILRQFMSYLPYTYRQHRFRVRRGERLRREFCAKSPPERKAVNR